MSFDKKLKSQIDPVKISCPDFPDYCSSSFCDKLPCQEMKDQILNNLHKIQDKDPYSLSDLAEWLKLESWDTRDAFLIMSNLSPDSAEINWKGFENFTGAWVDKIEVNNAQIFNEDEWFYLVPVGEEWENDPGLGNEVKRKRLLLRNCQDQLNQMRKIWRNSFKEQRNRYKISYFLDWADHHKIDIPWLKWATENNLVLTRKERIRKTREEYRKKLEQGIGLKEQILENLNLEDSEDEDPLEKFSKNLSLPKNVLVVLESLKYSSCARYLTFDTWPVKEAILLLSGIDPKTAVIDWDDTLEYLSGASEKHITIVEAILHDHSHKPLSDMGRKLMLDIVDDKTELSMDIKDVDTIKKRLKEYQKIEGNLNRIYQLWLSGEHDRDRYPVEYFVDWAKRKEIRPSWFDWAEKENLIERQGIKTDLHPRSERTYLNIIGALLEFIQGNSPGINKHPDYISQAKLIEHLSDFGIYGLKKATLENKFAAAKKSFESEQ